MAATRDHATHVLDELARRVERRGGEARIRLQPDGSMRFELADAGTQLSLLWIETGSGGALDVPVAGGNGVVTPSRSEGARPEALRALGVHVALQIEHVAAHTRSELLRWRNREPRTLHWGSRLLSRLCADLLVPGRTRYFDYRLTEVNELEGAVNFTFESRQRSVVLRWTLRELCPDVPLGEWGPLGLFVLQDDRTDPERDDPAHQVEHFVAFVLSRNLPPRFQLAFERREPPAGHLPDDFNVDLLHVTPPDDSSWFHMLFASSRDVGVVTCCDRECFNLFSFVSAPPETWLRYAPWQITPAPDLFERIYQVGLSGDTALLGNDRTERCLESIRAAGGRPELVVLIDSCLSRLVGDDIGGAATGFRAGGDPPLVLYDINLVQEPYLAGLTAFWANVYRAVVRESAPAVPGRVGLFGVDVPPGSELGSLLESLGLQVGARLFPRFSAAAVRELATSSLVVFSAWQPVVTMTTELREALPCPTVQLTLPYGFAPTVTWLRAISEAAGVAPVDELLETETTSRARDELELLVRQISGARIGVFCRSAELEQLTPRHRFGLDLLAILRELGLGIDLNLLVGPDEPFEPEHAERTLGLDPQRGDSVSTFTSWRELSPLLERGDFPLVYTETYRDARVTAAGKIPFNIGHLRPGLVGAVHGGRAVGALLGCHFYSRYQRYLSAPYAHYARPPGKSP